MVWGKTSDKNDHRNRSKKLTAAYHGPAGLPAPREGQIPGHWKSAPTGSRGGAPIWVMAEAWMPSPCYCDGTKEGPLSCPRHRGRSFDVLANRAWLSKDGRLKRTTPIGTDRAPDFADPDGFAVFGRFPMGFLDHVLACRLLGNVRREDILHVCSGTLSETEKWTVDIRPEAKPRVVADGKTMPFKSDSFGAVMLDPPYSDQYARNLYRTENPRPSWLLKEAARVVKPCGRIGLLHVAIPFAPDGCRLVKVYGVSCGVGFRIRAFTIWEKDQPSLL